MKSLSLLVFGLSTSFSLATVPPPGADGKYTLFAPGIRAQVKLICYLISSFLSEFTANLCAVNPQFAPYAASITNLFVTDKNGIERDVVLGYDTAAEYRRIPY